MNKPATSDELVKMEAVLQQRGGFFGRWGRWITLAILLAAAGAGYWRFQQSGRKAGPEQTFVTEPATRVDLVVRVTATGTVQPTTQVDISSEMSGIMRKVFVDFNSKVKTGDALAELDRAKLEASVEASKARVSVAIANVQDAQAALKEKRLAWERKQQLSRTNVVSKQDLETARASYDRAAATVVSAVASVNLAKADLKLQQTNLDRTRILSPINGIILMRKVDPGQTVASSLQAPVLFTIAEDLTKMEVQVNVDEADVGKVREGQKAVFSVDAYPNRKFDAHVQTLRFGSEVVQGVVTYKAVLATGNDKMLLRPGMTATAEIVVQNAANALTVPNQALRFTPPEAQESGASLLGSILPGRPRFREPSRQQPSGPDRRIFVLRDGVLTPLDVRIGFSDGRRTQIVSGGLKDADAVVVDAASGNGG